MQRLFQRAAVALATAAAGPAFAASSPPVQQLHVRAALLTQHDAIRPGEPFTVGLYLEADEHWHTYWRNPGESGLATKIAWKLPEGFEAGEIQWPTPTKFITDGPIVNFGYEGPVLLTVTIKPPAAIDAPRVTLTADASWLVCDPGSCVPGRAMLSVELPVSDAEPPEDAKQARRFADTLKATPLPIDAGRVRIVERSNTAVTVSVDVGNVPVDRDSVEFFPADGEMFEPKPAFAFKPGLLTVTLEVFNPAKPPTRLRGVLVLPDHAYAIDLKLVEEP